MDNTNSKKIIVVVDNDIEVHDYITAYFKPRGFEVICFSSANVAISEAMSLGESWDVLLTNYHFQCMSGVEFTKQIKKILPALKIIVIAPPDFAVTALKAVEEGAYSFVVKPINFHQLQISVDKALQHTALTQDISQLHEKINSVAENKYNIIGKSPKFLKALNLASRVAKSSANIFINGESGSGKEIFARYIHNESDRHKGPFVAINCSAIPEALLESELFGHAKGSFTGAQDKRIGLFEEAQDGTIFLDEIGDLNLSLQAKLLRVVQDKKIKRVGENQYRAISCRIISATHKDLTYEVKEKHFREDLYFRLNVIPIVIPPLRERIDDLVPLSEAFLRKFAHENGSKVKSFSKEAIIYILANKWRGNVRELENSIERAVVLCNHCEITLDDIMPMASGLCPIAEENQNALIPNAFIIRYANQLPTLQEVIDRYIEFAVAKKGGARDKTAKEIGIDRKTLYKRLKHEIHASQLSLPQF